MLIIPFILIAKVESLVALLPYYSYYWRTLLVLVDSRTRPTDRQCDSLFAFHFVGAELTSLRAASNPTQTHEHGVAKKKR